MTIARIFQSIPLVTNSMIQLDARGSHYLARVLRAKVGEKISVFNGEGGEYAGEIVAINKKVVEVKIGAFIAREAESPLHIHLAQGIARGEKMDFIMQKAVELGVSRITPLITERCNVRLKDERQEKRLQHWQGILVSACEQCGRNRLPVIDPPLALDDWLKTTKADYAFVLSPYVEGKLPKLELLPRGSIALLIGPEGGLSQEEVDKAQKNNFKPLNLGPRVLRTETATIAATALLQGWFGDMG